MPDRYLTASAAGVSGSRRRTAGPRAKPAAGARPSAAATSTPVARPASMRMPVATVRVSTVRFGRRRAGSNNALAVESRPAAMNRTLAKSVALRIKAGEIIAVSIFAERRKGIEKRLIQAIGFRNVRHVDGSVDAMHVEVAPVGIVFRQSKVRQHLLPAPAGVAGGRPIVVILAGGRGDRPCR